MSRLLEYEISVVLLVVHQNPSFKVPDTPGCLGLIVWRSRYFEPTKLQLYPRSCLATCAGAIGFCDKIIPAVCFIKSHIILDDLLQHKFLSADVVQGPKDGLPDVAYYGMVIDLNFSSITIIM